MNRFTSLTRGVRTTLLRVAGDRRGATVVEYGFIIALVVLVLMMALIDLADTTVNMWGDIGNKVEKAR